MRRLLADAPGLLELATPGLELEALTGVVVAGVEVDAARLTAGRLRRGSPSPSHPAPDSRVERVEPPVGYLGVLGGPLVGEVLGSMGTDSLSHTGPGWLRPGDVLGARPTEERPPRLGGAGLPGELDAAGTGRPAPGLPR